MGRGGGSRREKPRRDGPGGGVAGERGTRRGVAVGRRSIRRLRQGRRASVHRIVAEYCGERLGSPEIGAGAVRLRQGERLRAMLILWFVNWRVRKEMVVCVICTLVRSNVMI